MSQIEYDQDTGREGDPVRPEVLTKDESETITARIPAELAAEIDREAKRLGESKSVAIRWILRRGLAASWKEESDAIARKH